MSPFFPTIHRFAVCGSPRRTMVDGEAKSQTGNAAANGCPLPNAGDDCGGAGSVTGRTGSTVKSAGFGLSVTGSHVGGEVLGTVSRVLVVAARVPLPETCEIASASPLSFLAGRGAQGFCWFPQRRNRFRPAFPASSRHGGRGNAIRTTSSPVAVQLGSGRPCCTATRLL